MAGRRPLRSGAARSEHVAYTSARFRGEVVDQHRGRLDATRPVAAVRSRRQHPSSARSASKRFHSALWPSNEAAPKRRNPPFPAGFWRALCRTRTGDPFLTMEAISLSEPADLQGVPGERRWRKAPQFAALWRPRVPLVFHGARGRPSSRLSLKPTRHCATAGALSEAASSSRHSRRSGFVADCGAEAIPSPGGRMSRQRSRNRLSGRLVEPTCLRRTRGAPRASPRTPAPRRATRRRRCRC
jgi:hypothetical protein